MKKSILTFVFMAVISISYGQYDTLGIANNTAGTISFNLGAGLDCGGGGLSVEITLAAGEVVKVPPLGPTEWYWLGIGMITGGTGGLPSPCVCGPSSLVGITGTWFDCGALYEESVSFTP